MDSLPRLRRGSYPSRGQAPAVCASLAKKLSSDEKNMSENTDDWLDSQDSHEQYMTQQTKRLKEYLRAKLNLG